MCVFCDNNLIVSACCEAAVYFGKCSDCGKFCTEVPCFDCHDSDGRETICETDESREQETFLFRIDQSDRDFNYLPA